MDLETKTSLWDGDIKIAEQGDRIKVKTKMDEIIIGEYDYSNLSYLRVCREGRMWNFDLEDIQVITVLNQ